MVQPYSGYTIYKLTMRPAKIQRARCYSEKLEFHCCGSLTFLLLEINAHGDLQKTRI
jgi:hypothetical protein